ncbi:MAG: hypothetical protein JXR44_04130 [Thiotrichales bacterium]|nr:hypothetical protein [Thiotrichales bacterium]
MKLKSQKVKLLAFLGMFLSLPPAYALELQTIPEEDLTPEEKAWLEDDSFFASLEVSQGQLKWVDPQKTVGVYALSNRLILESDALKTGKVYFEQCHQNLDAIRAIDIVYNPETTSDLKVVSAKGVGRYQLQTAKVELYQVEQGAEVCIHGRNQTLTYDTVSQTWQIPRGPFMRKFLDGYYPMHLQETIEWEATALKWASLQINENPAAGTYSPKQNLDSSKSTLKVDYWFEGKLRPVYKFKTS